MLASSSFFSYLPSPDWNGITLGPFHLRAYGLMVALGVLAGYEVARRRWAARGGDPEDMTSIALWAVPAGLIGARLYHVITDWKTYFPDHPIDALKITEGGLGIPGGIILGVVVGVWMGHRRGIKLPTGLDAVVPAFPLGQAIGRWGNWFNQELFGRPSTLPWALHISPQHRPVGYEQFATYQPTFLYEMLWNLALFGFLIWLDRKRAIRPGNLLPLYVLGYGVGRLWVESLRSDHASLILGVRVNIWTSLFMIGGALIVFAVRGLRRRDGDVDEPYRDGHRFEPAPVVAASDVGDSGESGDAGD